MLDIQGKQLKVDFFMTFKADSEKKMLFHWEKFWTLFEEENVLM